MQNRYLKSMLLLLVCFLNKPLGFAQAKENFVIHRIDAGKGLSDNNVRCIYKDNRGIMWVGTRWGLNRIDGSTITVFNNIPDNKNSISNNVVNCITEGEYGLIWIGTEHGLNSYNPMVGEWKRLVLVHEGKWDLDVKGFASDKKGNLFVGTSTGLYIYNQSNGEVVYKGLPGNNYEQKLNNHITGLCLDKKGDLWLSTFNGLWCYHLGSGEFEMEVNAHNDPSFKPLITTFIFDHTGKVWYGTWDDGVKRFDPETKQVKVFKNLQEPGRQIRTILELKQRDGRYRIYLNSFYQYYDAASDEIVLMKEEDAGKLNSTVLYSRDGDVLWLGTDQGLLFCNTYGDLFKTTVHKKPTTSQSVSVLEWENKLLVSGDGGNFLKLYNKDLTVASDYSQHIGNGTSCLKMSFADKAVLRCGTSEGIADINLITHAIHFHQLTDTAGNSPDLRFITTLFEDSRHDWWYFPWRSGVWRTDSGSNVAKQVFRNFTLQFGVPKPLVISDVCEDANGNLWMGDYDEGIVFYDRKHNKFSKPFSGGDGQGNSVSQIIYYKHHCYSFIGASLWIWNTDSMRRRKVHFLPRTDKSINAVALDSMGNIWMATQNGLNVYNPGSHTYRHFSIADGLASNELNGTLYCCADGTMIFACPEFITSFRPRDLLSHVNSVPQIQLVETIVNGKPYPFHVGAQPRFDHNTHSFIFRWAVTDYNDPLNNRYYYKLEGADRDWRFAGRVAHAEFANLSPGDYTLLLKGENANGVEADRILKLHFTIMNPFWKSWWFLALIIAAFAGSFYILYRYRLHQILKIQQLRNKISLNLHDDIGSTLSSISILSDMALHRSAQPEYEAMLREIKENSVEMMDRMDDIVWSINPDNDSLEKLFLRVKAFSARLFEARGINYKIDISEEVHDLRLRMEYRQHLYLIIKEAINNLVKYSGCTEAQIKVSCDGPVLSVEVADNGSGFDLERESMGNGLVNMRKRANEIGTQLKIITKPGEGTKVRLVSKIK